VEKVLQRTLAFDLSEQVMECHGRGGLTGSRRLRRSMAAWRRSGSLQQFEQLKRGMQSNGHASESPAIYTNLGFGEYGSESHSASRAAVYVSS
jgi:error-prone DNA polymerase